MQKLQDRVDEGWSVHIYDRKRHLLCTFEPSHAWVFLLGGVLGLCLGLFWATVGGSSQPVRAEPAQTETPLMQVD
ncbi:MAG: hypothetical protein AAF289_15880 [Cyanobacteria bacterium P01_A01_bin.135]